MDGVADRTGGATANEGTHIQAAGATADGAAATVVPMTIAKPTAMKKMVKPVEVLKFEADKLLVDGKDLALDLTRNLDLDAVETDTMAQAFSFVETAKRFLGDKADADKATGSFWTAVASAKATFGGSKALPMKELTTLSEVVKGALFGKCVERLNGLVTVATRDIDGFRRLDFFPVERAEVQALYKKINLLEMNLTPAKTQQFTALTLMIEGIFRLENLTDASRAQRIKDTVAFTAKKLKVNRALYGLISRMIPERITPVILGARGDASYLDAMMDAYREGIDEYNTANRKDSRSNNISNKVALIKRLYGEEFGYHTIFPAMEFPILVNFFGEILLNGSTNGVDPSTLGRSFPRLESYTNMMSRELSEFSERFNLGYQNDAEVLAYFTQNLIVSSDNQKKDLVRSYLSTIEEGSGRVAFPLLCQFLNRTGAIGEYDPLEDGEPVQ